MNYWPLIAAALIAAAALLVVLRERRKTRHIMESMNAMLDKAMEGTFTEDCFDETLLSSLESKLAHYLAASDLSAKNVAAEKEKLKELIGDISHQTKTPIANILLYTQLLEEQGDSRCLTALESQTKKLQGLIDALVKTSRLETGVIALSPKPGKLQSVIESAAAQIRPKANSKNIELVLCNLDGDGVFDAKWTEEALYNLLDNAVKYIPEGGRIVVSTAVYPMFCTVKVEDNGPGIAEDEQARIFQRFYRGRNCRNQEGVGIGLYLVRQIAEGQGGYVKVSSAPGRGSCFSLFVPRD